MFLSYVVLVEIPVFCQRKEINQTSIGVRVYIGNYIHVYKYNVASVEIKVRMSNYTALKTMVSLHFHGISRIPFSTEDHKDPAHGMTFDISSLKWIAGTVVMYQ